MGRQGFLFELDGKRVMGFDTGLDARAFARAKLAQLLTEPGIIVRFGGAEASASVEPWKVSGVVERAWDDQATPAMVVWGPEFEGERLDLLVNDSERQDEALSAVSLWLEATLVLGEEHRVSASPWPCAAIIERAGAGQVFFAPPSLALRCLHSAEEALRFSGCEWYAHPDFGGAEVAGGHSEAVLPAHLAWRDSGSAQKLLKAALAKADRRTAFAAAAMLYRIFAGAPPFPATNDILLHQDMRDGNFLPIRYAAPGLDARLADLIQRALEPHAKRNAVTGTPMEKPLPSELLAGLRPPASAGETSASAVSAVSASSLVLPLSEGDRQLLEKEKSQFLKVKTATVHTKRFLAQNAGLLLAGIAGLVVAIFFISTIVNSRAVRPTTAGLEPIEVIERYYNAFGKLDYQMMESIVLRRVGRSDISMVINLFAINRVRMAHELNFTSFVLPAREWQEAGGGVSELAVFGVTDLQIEQVGRREPAPQQRRARRSRDEEELHFYVHYLFWVPAQMTGGPPPAGARSEAQLAAEASAPPLPVSFRHADLVTLVRRHGNWRISDITRVVLP